MLSCVGQGEGELVFACARPHVEIGLVVSAVDDSDFSARSGARLRGQ